MSYRNTIRMEVYAFFRNCPQGQILPVVLTAAIRIDVGDLLALRTIRILKNAARSRICGLCRSLQTILRINLDGTPTLVKSRYGADADKIRPSRQKEKRQASCDACRFSGTPDWIRTSGLQSRSYQAVKPESPAAQGFDWCCTNFRHFEEQPQNPYRTGLPRFFAVVVK